MTSGSRLFQAGWTLAEAVIVIVVIGVLTAMGSALFGNLAPSYFASVNSAQTLLAPEAAIWQMRQDFAHMVVSGTSQDGSCNLIIHTTTNYASPNNYIIYTFLSGTQIWRKVGAGTAYLLIDNVTAVSTCPYILQPGSGSSPTRLYIDFTYSTDPNKKVSGHMQTTLYSNDAIPQAALPLSPSCDNLSLASTVTVTITGTNLSSINGVSFGGFAGNSVALLSDTSVTVHTPALGPGVGLWSVEVSSPEGYYTLKNVFHYYYVSSLISTTGEVDISGSGLTSVTGVKFDGSPGTLLSVTDSLISVTPPLGLISPNQVVIDWGSTATGCPAGTLTY